ncbi:hypothetical protein A9R00_12275 [Oleispira antarctica]|uniref:Uncharacterized protein n=1 Tax=Oleispira antarctica TaxID=188908 RepID=A0A1Y5HGN7_OLEAN|nr:hypothetical protein A9R00_12275 [Oleispira antarctica]
MKWSLLMTHSNSLPSALKIAAEVDAALAQAGLAGPQVEREAIPLYLMFVQEFIDCSEPSPIDKTNVAGRIIDWLKDNPQPINPIIDMLGAQLNEVIELSKAHGTLQDFKRRELLNMHQKVVELLRQSSASLSQPHRDWL